MKKLSLRYRESSKMPLQLSGPLVAMIVWPKRNILSKDTMIMEEIVRSCNLHVKGTNSLL
jgi:hypothetical protein